MDRAKQLLDTGLKEGAVAFSTGLSYYPCAYSDTDELVELCKVVAENNSVYVTHTRTVFYKTKVDPILETIEIGERSGAKIHFSHFRTKSGYFGKSKQLMEHIDAAYQRGVDVTLELYPYPNGNAPALILLPPWASEDGYEATMERLGDKKLRDVLIQGIEENVIKYDGYFSHLPKNKQYVGMHLKEVAQIRGQSIPDMLCDLLFEEELEVGFKQAAPFYDAPVWDTFHRDCLELLSRPYYMVGSDSIPLGSNPHPRTYGTFPKLLRLCREYGFSLEKMINRMTKVPAERFGLTDRGTLDEGKAADIVILDAEHVMDTASYHQPRSAPRGISYVLVNGQVAVREEKVTGVFAGQALSRS